MRSLTCGLLAAFLLVVSLGAQTTATFEPVKDNSMYAENGSLSNGAGTGLFAGMTAIGFTRRCLLAFDLSSIPAGATISSASLDLQVTMASPFTASNNLDLHLVLQDWGEGASVAFGGQGGGGPAQTGDATWDNTFFNTALWATPGGDFIPTRSATTTTLGAGTTTNWSSAGMAADVQAWVNNPATNFGWLIKGAETASATARRFASRESAAGTRPVLTVTYTTGPVATVVSTGTGCQASNGSATFLAASGLPQIGNLGFAVNLTGPNDGLVSQLYLAGSTGPALPIGGGCFIYLDLITADLFIQSGVSPFTANITGGVATYPLPIPAAPSLGGVTVTVQAAVFDTSLLLSNALTLTVGN